jgi:LysM domain
MALRREDLIGAPDAVVVRFPLAVARARARRARRRFALRRLLVGLMLIGIPAGVVASGGGEPMEPVAASSGETVIVQPGDTIWGIAELRTPAGTDPRAFVDAIIALNDLDGGALQAGDELELPR